MENLKRVVAINDISCVGRCSLTVALPLISAAGIECSILPTAILSTHTGGFTGFTFKNLSDEMDKIVNHWQSLNLHVDTPVKHTFLAPSFKQAFNNFSIYSLEWFPSIYSIPVIKQASVILGKMTSAPLHSLAI